MNLPLDATVIQTIKSAARKLQGAARRVFQAEATRDDCKGSPRMAERKFGWSRHAVQKGLDEWPEVGESPNTVRQTHR